MAFNALYAACIRRAARRLGGYDALAARVGVSATLLERCARREAWASESVFLRIVDILLEETPPAPPSNQKPGNARRL